MREVRARRSRGYALFLFCAATAIALPAQTFTNLLSFNLSDGGAPSAPVIQGLDGMLYGTASSGGAHGRGTVFKITPAGNLTIVHSFCPRANCPDGTNPFAGLALDNTGNFYGTTPNSGANGFGGTVFKITPVGTLATLHSFCARTNCTDGNSPFAGLIQASDGDFYGTTASGGTFGGGTVFKITPEGTLTTLHSFCAQSSCADGEFPNAGLVQAADGNFYGTTVAGGAGNSDLCSVIGSAEPCGTVFKITSRGIVTTLYSFCSQSKCADGGLPLAPLIQATDGNFYGTTTTAGANGNGGTVFKITPAGRLTTLYSFCAQTNCTDGNSSEGGLFQATNGTFYGTTLANGLNLEGTVFSLNVGLGPFVETLPSSATVGTSVNILGNDLEGTTTVRFNGTAATFTVVSNSHIKANVPKGSTTGFVTVTTPTHILTSSKKFSPL